MNQSKPDPILPENLPEEEIGPTFKGKKEQDDLFKRQKAEAIHRVTIWSIRVGAIIIGLVILVRIWHYVSPLPLQWLKEEEIRSLDKFLFSGAIGTGIGTFIRDAFKNK